MTKLELLRETFNDYESLRRTSGDLSKLDLPELSLVAVHRKSEQEAADEKLFDKVTKVLGRGVRLGAIPFGAWLDRSSTSLLQDIGTAHHGGVA